MLNLKENRTICGKSLSLKKKEKLKRKKGSGGLGTKTTGDCSGSRRVKATSLNHKGRGEAVCTHQKAVNFD